MPKTPHPHLRLLPPPDPANVDRYSHEDDQARHQYTARLIQLVRGGRADAAWDAWTALGLDPNRRRPHPHERCYPVLDE